MRTRSPVASLVDLPVSDDPDHHTLIRLLARTSSLAYNDPLCFVFITSRLVRLSIEHGNAPCSGFGYVFYGMIVSGSGDFATAHEFGALAMKISERLDRVSWRSLTQFLFSAFLQPWRHPPPESVPVLEQAYVGCLETGNMAYASFAKLQIVILEFVSGTELHDIIEHSKEYALFQRRSSQRDGANATALYQCFALRLKYGAIPEDSEPHLDERELFDKVAHYPSILVSCRIADLGVTLILRNLERAKELASEISATIQAITGHIQLVDFSFFMAMLAIIRHDEDEDASEAPAEQRALAEAELTKLQAWGELCPENFEHKPLLVAAELARIDGRELEAMELYDRAIELAAANGFYQWAGFAGERSARFQFARGRKQIARSYLEEARYSYQRWGADGKVALLDEEFELLLSRRGAAVRGEASREVQSLDLLSVVKASQAISGEIVLVELLNTLMSTLLENAGAQRGVLILAGEPETYVVLDESRGDKVALHGSAEGIGVAQSLVRYVQRTSQTVVLGDAAGDSTLATDHHIAEAQPRSVLCMPVFGRRRLVGVLYLENNLTRFAFTPERCRVLKLLSAQAAISLENAQLYDTLESRVRERTRDLDIRNEELSRALARVEATQKQLVEQEKLASLGALTAGVAHELRNPPQLRQQLRFGVRRHAQ